MDCRRMVAGSFHGGTCCAIAISSRHPLSIYALSDALYKGPNYGRAQSSQTSYWLSVCLLHRCIMFWTHLPVALQSPEINEFISYQLDKISSVVLDRVRHPKPYKTHFRLITWPTLPKKGALNLEARLVIMELEAGPHVASDERRNSEALLAFSSRDPLFFLSYPL